jgi:hypothetical protein
VLNVIAGDFILEAEPLAGAMGGVVIVMFRRQKSLK